jgi:hypothetical protein
MRRRLNRIALTALVATLGALAGVTSAPATVLEVGGDPENSKVEITASLEAGTSAFFSGTSGEMYGPYGNICTESHASGNTESPYSGSKVTGPISVLSFTGCEFPVTVHKAGKLYVEHIAGTTNGTVSSEEAQVTVKVRVGATVNCTTGAGADLGTLTGVSSGHATMHINAVLNCGFLLPSALWKGSYTITSPTGLGVLKEVPPPPPPTTLEVGGTSIDEEVEITSSLQSGSSTVLSRTDGTFANTCTESHASGNTESPYSGSKVTGPFSSLSFSGCTRSVTVHKAGKLYVTHIAGTTDGTVFSEEAEVTSGSPFGVLNCKTNAGTDMGRLTGGKEGHATVHINAVINCGFLVPSAKWEGTYTVTSPTGLGVTE